MSEIPQWTWPAEALADAMRDFHGKRPAWGEVDCCQFAARYWDYVNDEQLAAAWQYESERAALRIIAAHGNLGNVVSELIGPPRAGEAQPGDIVLVQLERHVGVGVHAGYCVFTIDPEEGLGRVDCSTVVEAWPCHRR